MTKEPPAVCPETRFTELLLGLSALWWVLLLSVPVNLFASNAAFLGLAQRAEEHIWAVLMGGNALLYLAGLVTRNPLIRFCGMGVGVVAWLFIATGIVSTSPQWHGLPINTGFGVYSLYAVVSFLCLVRLAVPVLESLPFVPRFVRWRATRRKAKR